MDLKDPKIHAPPPQKKPRGKLATLDAKILSFCYSGSMVSWNRFCSLWLLKCGFSPREVGLMKSLSLVGKLIAQPLWAGSADVGAPADVLMGSVLASVATLEALRRTSDELTSVQSWNAEKLENILRPLAEKLEVKTGQLFGSIRVAITGKKATPPLFETMVVLGEDICKKRINDTIASLE